VAPAATHLLMALQNGLRVRSKRILPLPLIPWNLKGRSLHGQMASGAPVDLPATIHELPDGHLLEAGLGFSLFLLDRDPVWRKG
jgi:hypothetical protein